MKKTILLMMILAAVKLHAQINITSAKVIYKTDTIHYVAEKYTVSPSAKVLQLLKKLEGFEITADSSLKHQGQQVKFIRINGKHYDGMTMENVITKLPAEVVEGIEVIDDYSGISPLTSNTPVKLLNINIKNNRVIDLRSFGYRGNTSNYYLPNEVGYVPVDANGRYRFRNSDQFNIADRTQTARQITRQIDRLQYAIDMQGREVDDYGDQVPHHLPGYASWPRPKAKPIKVDSAKVKPVN